MTNSSAVLSLPYLPSPLSVTMVKRVFQWNDIDLDSKAKDVAEQMLALVRRDKGVYDFISWYKEERSLRKLSGLKTRWVKLLFASVSAANTAQRRHTDLIAARNQWPYWQISCLTACCDGHSEFNGFIARFDDPVWNSVFPLNGWACGCNVLSLTEREAKAAPMFGKKLSPEMVERCSNWLDQRPEQALELV
jgi:hypothetical protein